MGCNGKTKNFNNRKGVMLIRQPVILGYARALLGMSTPKNARSMLKLGDFDKTTSVRIGQLDDDQVGLFVKAKLFELMKLDFKFINFRLTNAISAESAKLIRRKLVFSKPKRIAGIRMILDNLFMYSVFNSLPVLLTYPGYDIRDDFEVFVDEAMFQFDEPEAGQLDMIVGFYPDIMRILKGETIAFGEPNIDYDDEGFVIGEVQDPIAKQIILYTSALEAECDFINARLCEHSTGVEGFGKKRSADICHNCQFYSQMREDLVDFMWSLVYYATVSDLISPTLLRAHSHMIGQRHGVFFCNDWKIRMADKAID